MTYEEFEWHLLRLVYEEGVEKLQPSYLAYALGLTHETVTSWLEQAVHAGLLEMDVTEEGRLEYFIPGADPGSVPRPIWKRAEEEAQKPRSPEEAVDGSVEGADGSTSSDLPPALAAHVESIRGTDGAVQGRPYPVVQAGVAIEEEPAPQTTALIRTGTRANPENLPLRIEASDEAFCDPARTMFMRQIRVYGAPSQAVLRAHIVRLFQSFGYRVVDAGYDRMRFERGSVMFILALIPLFVLVLPLFIYLFLYGMGRSTIHQEPLELDVQIRQREAKEPFWEIDLTFVGLHGVVLGAADQQVLNREIDLLHEELHWALTSY